MLPSARAPSCTYVRRPPVVSSATRDAARTAVSLAESVNLLKQSLDLWDAMPMVKRVLDHPIDRVFHALADPTRRRMIERLARAPASVSDLAAPLDMTLAAVVQHVQVLEESGVVRTEKVGRVRTCRIEPGGLRVAERWLSERRALWERRLDRLGELLDEEEGQIHEAHSSKKRKRS